MAKGKKTISFFTVKIKISIPGFQNKFYQGICLAENSEKARETSLNYLLNAMNEQKQPVIILKDHLSITKCDKVRDQFVAHQFKD